MYGRKTGGPKMEPWGTPALTGYYCWLGGGVGVEHLFVEEFVPEKK